MEKRGRGSFSSIFNFSRLRGRGGSLRGYQVVRDVRARMPKALRTWETWVPSSLTINVKFSAQWKVVFAKNGYEITYNCYNYHIFHVHVGLLQGVH